jgi:hypothetical protein
VVEAADIDVIDIAAPNGALRDRHRRGEGRQDGALREAAGAERRRRPSRWWAVEEAGVPNMVWYNYRRVPAISLAKQLMDEGRIGKPFHYRATYLQDWTISPGRAAGRRRAVAAGRRRWPARA